MRTDGSALLFGRERAGPAEAGWRNTGGIARSGEPWELLAGGSRQRLQTIVELTCARQLSSPGVRLVGLFVDMCLTVAATGVSV